MGAFIEMHDRLRHIGKPTIARINGACVGGGNELQMACDLSVIVDDGYIRHVGPEHGSVPAGGATQWLPLIVGDRRAREIIMLCEPVSPAQALDWGLVRESFRAASSTPPSPSWRRSSPQAARGDALHEDPAQLVARPRLVPDRRARPDWLAVHSTADETREAVAAFHEKRPPRFAELRRLEAGDGRVCPSCGARGLPAKHRFCGECGRAPEIPDVHGERHDTGRSELSAVMSVTIYSLRAAMASPE